MTQNDEVVLEAFTDFLNAVDAGITHARETIKKYKGISIGKSGTWNPTNINWQTTNGKKGIYEKSVDYENLQHKALIFDLENHDGKLMSEGFFYWLFTDQKTVGRKKK